MPKCDSHDTAGLPTPNLKRLADYALQPASKDFRGKACKRNSFQAVIDAELAGPGNNQYACLTRDEAVFVEGWIYLAESEFLNADGTVDDAALVKAIERSVKNSVVPMSG